MIRGPQSAPWQSWNTHCAGKRVETEIIGTIGKDILVIVQRCQYCNATREFKVLRIQ